MHSSLAFVLRGKAFRDNSLLVDIFTQEAGRISAVARYSKKQGTRLKGMLEPFRLLEISWIGRGEIYTLVQAEEKGRYRLQQQALVQGLYANELILRAFESQQAIPELFQLYRPLLQHLQAGPNALGLMRFELELLANLGYELNLWQTDGAGQDIDLQMRYRFRPEVGLQAVDEFAEPQDTLISGALLVALRSPDLLELSSQQELRQVLDRLWRVLLQGKTLYARQLWSE